MTAKVIGIRLRARPLRKTYQPDAPYVVERRDMDNGAIYYEVYDERPDSYRFVTSVGDDWGQNPYAKHDAEQIASALNFMVQLGKEQLPKVRERDDD